MGCSIEVSNKGIGGAENSQEAEDWKREDLAQTLKSLIILCTVGLAVGSDRNLKPE